MSNSVLVSLHPRLWFRYVGLSVDGSYSSLRLPVMLQSASSLAPHNEVASFTKSKPFFFVSFGQLQLHTGFALEPPAACPSIIDFCCPRSGSLRLDYSGNALCCIMNRKLAMGTFSFFFLGLHGHFWRWRFRGWAKWTFALDEHACWIVAGSGRCLVS